MQNTNEFTKFIPMLSIIICSIEEYRLVQLKENIAKSIGSIDYEIIVINNLIQKLDIAVAYNRGIENSKFPYLIFLHEDIIFHTQDWGKIVLKYFENSKVGLLGVAGSRIKTEIPSGWWHQRSKHILMNIIQHPENGKKQNIQFGFEGRTESEVVVIDGVFMAARKTENIRFDENLSGFHNYDQSISLLYRKNQYKVLVTNKILIEHFSEGNKNEEWIDSLVRFHHKYNSHFPQVVENGKIEKEDRAFSCLRFIYNCRNNHKKSLAFKYWLKYLMIKPMDRKNFQMLKYFIS